MALERTHFCPDCDGERAFYRSASTYIHLGLKVKWTCPDCDYQFVEIGDIVSDAADA
jgi:rubredoxin